MRLAPETDPPATGAASTGPPVRVLWRLQYCVLALAVVGFALLQAFEVRAGQFLGSEWREADTAAIARNFLSEPDLLYPRIDWGAPGPGYVETELQLYPFAVQLLYRLFGPDPRLGQLLSVLLTACSSLVLYRLARRFLPRWPAVLAVAAFASSPVLFRFTLAFMPEATALLFYLLAAERFVCHRQRGRTLPLLAAGLALAVAILVKPTTIHLGLWCGLVTWRQQGLRAALAPRMLAFGAIALVPCVLFFWHAARLHTQYGNTFGVISGGDSKWGGPTWWFDPHFYAELARIDLWQTFGVGGSVLAVLGLWLWRCDSFRAVVLIWFGVIFVYYLIIARYASNETSATHYHIFTAVPAALAVGAGAAGLNDLCRQHGWSVQGVALVVLLPVMLIVQQVRRDWLVGLLEELPVFRAAGVELARLSAPEDLAIVTSTSSRISRGVTDNFEDPRVLYYAWRHGRMLPADELRAEELHRLLGIGARWVVVFDEVLPQAQPDFLAALADLEVAARGADFTIYRVRA